MTSLGFVWFSENLTPEQIPAFEMASIVVLMISIGILPIGEYLIGNYYKEKKIENHHVLYWEFLRISF